MNHEVASINRTKNYRYTVRCRCGEKSPSTTKTKALDWYFDHAPWGIFARVFTK